MKFRIILFAAVLAIVGLSGQTQGQQITTPRTASPAAMVSQTIGISTVTVNYSRPSVKGRKVWGALVPYGYNAEPFGNGKKAPWRAGANENTTITFSHAAKVEGKPVPAGTYGLFFAVNEDNTAELVLSKDHRSWGNYFYDEKQDQLRARIQTKDAPHAELLTYAFSDITATATVLTLSWAEKQFPVRIEFAVPEIVLENAANELKGDKGFSWQAHASAANYALQQGTHLDEALVWSDHAISQNRNFTTLNTKARVLGKMGKKAQSDSLSAEAFKMATEAELNAFGYQLMNQGDIDKAIEVFTMNTKKYPKSANCYDSLGEAYATKGDKQMAITNFKKALSMNPEPNVRANSEKFLTQLEAK
jgi:tetratricopeptide (TPR) repeat protein